MNEFESDWISLSQESDWSESVFEWIWEKKTRCLNPTWQNSRWLPSSSWVRMNESTGRIQDGSHHQVNQIELVWVRVEGECFGVNLREDKKVSESIQHGRIQDGCHHQIESEIEWVKIGVRVFLRNGRIQEGLSQLFLIQHGFCKLWEPILASVSKFERKN